MPPLPRITPAELLAALHRLGFIEHRQRGSHKILRRPEDPSRFAVVAYHARATIPPGTLRHVLATAKVSVEELQEGL